MARCPYALHRLSISSGYCRRCNGDVRLYAALQALPVLLFNEARQLWDRQEDNAAAVLLEQAISARPSFAPAHWLLAGIEARRGNVETARGLLARANDLGAPVDTRWLDEQPADTGMEPAETQPVAVADPEASPPAPGEQEVPAAEVSSAVPGGAPVGAFSARGIRGLLTSFYKPQSTPETENET